LIRIQSEFEAAPENRIVVACLRACLQVYFLAYLPAEAAMDATKVKVKENRLRRIAARRGLALKKSKRRDPQALDYGAYWIVDPFINALLSDEIGMDLDGIEEWLTTE
jgi:hypothetical protein